MRGEVVCVEADGMWVFGASMAEQPGERKPKYSHKPPCVQCKQTLWKVSVALRLSLGLHLPFLGFATKQSSVLEGAQRRTLEMLSG